MEKTHIHSDAAALPLRQRPGWYRALTLTERASSPQPGGFRAQSSGDPGSTEKAQRRLQRWKEQAPFDQDSLFADRLAIDELTESDLLELLAEPIEAVQARLPTPPGWLVELQQAFTNHDADSDLSLPLQQVEELSDSIAFLYPAQPLLRQGLQRLETAIQDLVSEHAELPFDPQTIVSLLFAHLAQQVLLMLSRTLLLELNVAHLQGRVQGETAEELLQRYLYLLSLPENIISLLEEYCVLARQLVTTVDHWVISSLEFLRHLCADWRTIRMVFTPHADPDVLTAITTIVGGTHRGGRRAMLLAFRSGFHLIYKPRSLAIDQRFQELLTWLNGHGQQPALRPLKLLPREDHGWCEFIAASACRSGEEAVRFYERQGAYLALLYALGAVDFRSDHIIAAGEYPMLVDLTALFHPHLANDPFLSGHPAHKALDQSVLRVGLLSLCTSPDYCDHVVSGFTNMYRLLVEHRDEFLEVLLPRFARDEIRFLVRKTRVYALLLSDSFHPNVLRDALQRDRCLDRLWLSVRERSYLSRLIAAERADLLQGDIPVFTTCPDSCDLYTSRGKRVPQFFSESGLKLVAQRLSLFDAEDLARQIWLIRASFMSMSMSINPAMKKMLALQPSLIPATRERLVGAACAVGERLRSLAVYSDDAAGWLGMAAVKGHSWALLPADGGLYSGIPGIVLFLGYLGYITGETRFTELARLAFKTIRYEIEEQKKQPEAGGVGGFCGLGALIYLFSHLGVLWNEPDLFQEARELAGLLASSIGTDDKLDLLAGSAGCIANLICLHSVKPSPSILAIAIECGDHLLARAQSMKVGVAWYTLPGELPLTGFSHGTAGIAWSLLSLAAISGQERFRRTALAALAYERSLFSQEQQNWPDLRKQLDREGNIRTGREEKYQSTWCHGAPGIGLARLASLAYLDDMYIRKEIDIALKTTLAEGFGHNHSLCHGDFGNLETLLVATQMLDDLQYHGQLEQITGMLLDSFDTSGWITGVPLGIETPGLMTGLAGIGFELLRLAEPARVPSVLLLAPPFSLVQNHETFSGIERCGS